MTLNYVGHPSTRIDAADKATGKLLYTYDMSIPGMLHAKVLRSPHPHARILAIDTSAAEAYPGVSCVITGRDVQNVWHGGWIKDRLPYALDRVRYVGEPVAGVAAVNERTAEEALRLIKVEYELLPAVFDAREAARQDAPVIHPDMSSYTQMEKEIHPKSGTNINNHIKIRKGDVEKGFAEADLIVEEEFSAPKVQHCTLEPHVVMVNPETNGHITVTTSAQGVHVVRNLLCSAFGIPMNKLRVINPPIGGGFGGKASLKIESLCLPLALKAGAPVRLLMGPEEDIATVITRTPVHVKMKSGVTREGKLTARQVTLHWDAGGYAEAALLLSKNAGYASSGPYAIPNIHIDSYCVYTNNLPGGALRGFGVSEVIWAGEQHADTLAEKLGISPLEFRRINILKNGDTTSTGQVLKYVGLDQTLEEVASRIDLEPITNQSGDIRRGRGIACLHKGTVCPTTSNVIVQLHPDGTLSLNHGAIELGQGVHTVIRQMAAESLDVTPESISITQTPDSDTAPLDWQIAASRATFNFGNAIFDAAANFKEQAFALTAKLLRVKVQELGWEKGRVYLLADPERGLTLKELAKGGFDENGKFSHGNIIAPGSYTNKDFTTLDPETGQSANPTIFWMYGTQAAEVEVNIRTGEIKVLKLIACHDAGKVINPVTAAAQIEGALVMGTGMALYEGTITDKGKILNGSLVDYKVVRSADQPELDVSFVEVPHGEGPYGAKGLAEAGLCSTAGAIANAVHQATGIKPNFIPMRSEQILELIKSQAAK